MKFHFWYDCLILSKIVHVHVRLCWMNLFNCCFPDFWGAVNCEFCIEYSTAFFFTQQKLSTWLITVLQLVITIIYRWGGSTCSFWNIYLIGRPSMKKVEDVKLMKEAAELDRHNILRTEGKGIHGELSLFCCIIYEYWVAEDCINYTCWLNTVESF